MKILTFHNIHGTATGEDILKGKGCLKQQSSIEKQVHCWPLKLQRHEEWMIQTSNSDERKNMLGCTND